MNAETFPPRRARMPGVSAGLPDFVGAELRPTVEHAPTLRTLCCLVTCSRVARIGYTLILPISMGSGISTPDQMMETMELEILHVISKSSRKFEEKHRRAFPLLLWKASVSSILLTYTFVLPIFEAERFTEEFTDLSLGVVAQSPAIYRGT